MKALIQSAFLLVLLSSTAVSAQYGYGNNGGRYGQNRGSTLPQSQTPVREPEIKTAEEIVDAEMPNITEQVGLDPFEQAVVRTILIKYIEKRSQLQILELEPEKAREGYLKLQKEQDEELKTGLPEEKYEAYKKLEKNRFKKKKKKKKKKS